MRSILARVHDSTVAGHAWLGRNRRISSLPSPALINVGSGVAVAPGWVNVDLGLAAMIAGWPTVLQRMAFKALPSTSATKQDLTADQFCEVLRSNRFVHSDIRHGLPFASDSVDALFTSHFVEHLTRSDAEAFFAEALRVVRSGGVARVCVPDLDHALGLFEEGQSEEALGYFFVNGATSTHTQHRWMWNYTSLSAALKTAGFATVRRCAYREGVTPDLGVLDNRRNETLYVEAVA
jgi:SAM-dependent methyltransferase